MYQGGYTGKILRINLTDQTSTEEALPFEIARDYIGGAGIGIKYLFDEVDPNIDPLGPDNKLIFAPGPFSGTSAPCASRMAVTGKSPLTNCVGMSLTGGHFPVEMKFAGYDGMIIEGKAEKPTYLWIKDGKVQFKSAKNLMGLMTSDCQTTIRNKLKDQNIRVACIGPAGERLSKMAAIINEMRAFGRKGMGAIMGSKNLKAIAIRGEQPVKVADEEKFKKARKKMLQAMKDSHVLYPKFAKNGTPIVVDVTTAHGIFPLNNYSATGTFEMVDELGEEAQSQKIIGREFCYNCPVGCSQVKLVKEGPYAGTMAEGPEFETIYSFGGVTGVKDINAVIKSDRLADEYGLDTMSAGVTIAFAMELYEKGLLTDKDTDGLELKFGNGDAMVEMMRKIAFREGLGDLLADGVKIAAEKLGKGSEKFAMHVKGLELPGYDVRGAKAHGLNYATSYTGADHNRGYAFQEIFGIPVPEEIDRLEIKGKGKLTKWNQDVRTATIDCPTMCGFLLDMAVPGFATQNTADLMAGVTGIELTADAVQKVGERINNLARAFNVLAGFNRSDDCLPDRLMNEPLKDGNSKGQTFSRKQTDVMLDEYYTERGWDLKTGIPTRTKLEELGIGYAADRIKNGG
jgi:aldehyde:ferredoxin oxidoreductase